MLCLSGQHDGPSGSRSHRSGGERLFIAVLFWTLGIFEHQEPSLPRAPDPSRQSAGGGFEQEEVTVLALLGDDPLGRPTYGRR